jgi:hypothetical protein
LQTLDLVLGTAIHARAREIARAITGGHERPPLDKLRERTRAELNAVCLRSRDLGAFLRDPKSHPVLQSAYYGFGVSKHTAARVRAKMERCLASLVTSSVWDDLATCPRAAVRIIDAPALFDTDATSVWVVPDLIYTPRSGRTTIVDWKTGNADGAAVHQLSLYAWFVRDVLALPMGPAGYEGRVVELGSGTEWYVDLTDEAITEARERLGTSVDAMQALLEAPDHVRPKAIAHFPLTEERRRCSGCNFLELCERELEEGSPRVNTG